MRNRIFVMHLVLMFLGVLLLAPVAQADHGSGYSYHKGGKDKFFKKAHFILKNKEEMGLSEEQVQAIVALKLETKKEVIRRKAEIDVLMVDLKGQYYQDQMDLDLVNGLIDQKYAAKAAKAKTLVAAFAQLKSQLSDDQWARMKELKREWKEKRRDD